MQCTRKLQENLYWVGANDRRLALFENVYPIPHGVSYNAYVLLDEKTVLLDTVDAAVGDQFFENLAYALGGRSLAQMLKIHEAQRLELVDRQRDVAPARRAVRRKPEVFGLRPDVSDLLPATCHASCSLFLTYDRNKDTPMRAVSKSFLAYVGN